MLILYFSDIQPITIKRGNEMSADKDTLAIDPILQHQQPRQIKITKSNRFNERTV